MAAWNGKIRILHLEDNLDDMELLNVILKKSKLKYELSCVSSKQVFLKVNLSDYDILITDYSLADYDGLSAIKHVRTHSSVMPVILLSGTLREELATELLRVGATDFILKSNLKKMPIAIQRAMLEASLTSQKQEFQRELLKKNLILDTIFDSFEDIIFLKDLDGKYLKVNRAFCDFLQRTEAEIIGGSEIDFFPSDTAKKALENDEYVKLSGKSVIYEQEYLSDGKRIVLEVKKIPLLDEKEVTGIMGQCSDVTARKILLEETVKAKSILSQAEKLTRSGSFEYDTDLDLLICSSNLKHMLQLQIEGDTISFRKFAQLIKEEDRKIFYEGISQAVAKYEGYRNEHRFTVNPKKDSEIEYFKVVLKPDYKDEKGTRFYGTIIDVSADRASQIQLISGQENERKELARELHDNLGQKMNAVSMFVSKLADDSGNADMLKAKDLIHESIDDLSYLISNISVKQIEEHSLEYAIEKLLGYVPSNIKVDSEFEFQEEDISQFVKTQIYRIVQEVFNNIIKYAQASKIKFGLTQDGGLISLNIEDDGIGFEMEEAMNGNGFQNITYRVRRANGIMEIDSNPGEGVKVMIKMPLN